MLKAAKDAWTTISTVIKQASWYALEANLKAARLGLKPAATHLGSLDENEVAANVENRPELSQERKKSHETRQEGKS